MHKEILYSSVDDRRSLAKHNTSATISVRSENARVLRLRESIKCNATKSNEYYDNHNRWKSVDNNNGERLNLKRLSLSSAEIKCVCVPSASSYDKKQPNCNKCEIVKPKSEPRNDNEL